MAFFNLYSVCVEGLDVWFVVAVKLTVSQVLSCSIVLDNTSSGDNLFSFPAQENKVKKADKTIRYNFMNLKFWAKKLNLQTYLRIKKTLGYSYEFNAWFGGKERISGGKRNQQQTSNRPLETLHETVTFGE